MQRMRRDQIAVWLYESIEFQMALGWSGNLDKMVEHHLLVPVLVDAYVLSVREVLDDQYAADDWLFSLSQQRFVLRHKLPRTIGC